MKRIGLISDTHGHFDPLLPKYLEDCDEIWHAGDIGNEQLADRLSAWKPLVAVYGNIDGAVLRRMFPKDAIWECEGLRIFMTHIGGYPGKYPASIRKQLVEHKPGLFICGHSHILKVMYDKELGLVHMNPGAAGVHGFHLKKTLIRFGIHEGKIVEPQVVELGNRTHQ
jgi:hypothetical protein